MIGFGDGLDNRNSCLGAGLAHYDLYLEAKENGYKDSYGKYSNETLYNFSSNEISNNGHYEYAGERLREYNYFIESRDMYIYIVKSDPIFIWMPNAFSNDTHSNEFITITGAILGAEDIYNNLAHNHNTYKTTKGITKNIFKSNGTVRSARALRYAKTSRFIKLTGVASTVFLTGVATANIIYDISNNNTVSIKDIVDGSVGLVGLAGFGLSSAGIISNPAGWAIGAGVALYGWGSLWYDIGAEYGFSKW